MSPTSYQTAPPRTLMIATVFWSVKRLERFNSLQPVVVSRDFVFGLEVHVSGLEVHVSGLEVQDFICCPVLAYSDVE